MVEGLNMIYLLYCYYIKDKYIRFFDIKICVCVKFRKTRFWKYLT